MNKYNYLENITNDILTWMDKDGDPFDISQFENRDEVAEFLNCELWEETSITGNNGYYYSHEYDCEEYLCHNIDLALEACQEFGVEIKDILKHYQNNELARYLDCTIRCYLLTQAIYKALEIWEECGFKYNNKNIKIGKE